METKLKSLNLNEIESDSEDEELEETNVDVGLIEDDPEELSPEDRKLAAMRLRSPFFPSKVGGKPAWLDFSQVSNVNLTCESCKSQMVFLLQIYAPVSGKDQPLESPIDCFHRVLYVFVCNSNQCTLKTAKLVRSQMRRQNEFYSYEAPPQEDSYDSDADYDLACFKHLKSFNSNLYAKNLFNLCSVCGFSCAKKCSKCFFVCFCSQSHQIIDWTTLSHKSLCSKYAELKQNNENEKLIESWTEDEISIRSFIKSPAVFPEREIVIEPEVLDEKRLAKNSKDNKFDENKIKQLMAANNDEEYDKDLDDIAETESDKDFEKFKKISAHDAYQVVRYERGGKPLWTTKHGKLTEDKIPKCEHCGSKRIFEFQVTPQLLCYLNLDESKQSNSIDWAGLYAFTCSKSCKAANDGYSNEFIYKQDFISK